MSRNEITGDKLQSKVGNTEAFNEGYNRIFKERKRTPPCSAHSILEEDMGKHVECHHWVVGWEGSLQDNESSN